MILSRRRTTEFRHRAESSILTQTRTGKIDHYSMRYEGETAQHTAVSLSTMGSSHREGGSCQADKVVDKEWQIRAILAIARAHKITELGTV